MNLSDIEKAIDSINKRIEDLDTRSIKIVIDPTTKLYLSSIINDVVTTAFSTKPTS
jgi:hypothetical protein